MFGRISWNGASRRCSNGKSGRRRRSRNCSTTVPHIDVRYTPRHGSWLNIAEDELSCFTCQCASGRRLGSEEELRAKATACYGDLNATSTRRGMPNKNRRGPYKVKFISRKIKL